MERASPLDELCITVSSKDAISGTYQQLSVDQDSVGKPICTNQINCCFNGTPQMPLSKKLMITSVTK